MSVPDAALQLLVWRKRTLVLNLKVWRQIDAYSTKGSKWLLN